MATAAVAAAAAAARRRVIETFRIAGATRPEDAVTPPAFDRRMERRILERLVRAGAIRETGDGRSWLDEAALAAYRRKRRTRALALAGAMLGVAAIALGVSLV